MSIEDIARNINLEFPQMIISPSRSHLKFSDRNQIMFTTRNRLVAFVFKTQTNTSPNINFDTSMTSFLIAIEIGRQDFILF